MVNNVKSLARASARAYLVEEVARFMVANKATAHAAAMYHIARIEREPAFRQIVQTATSRNATRAVTLSKQSLYRWMKAAPMMNGARGQEDGRHARWVAPPWLLSFMAALHPTIPTAYKLWTSTGMAPDPAPSINDVRRAVRTLRGRRKRGLP